LASGGARYATTDYAYSHGLSLQLLNIAFNCARTQNTSMWRLLYIALSNALIGRRPKTRDIRLSKREFVRREVIENGGTDGRSEHPLLDTQKPIPGKHFHILGLLPPQQFYDPMGYMQDPERVEPLASQPLIELALHIPTFVLAARGEDRSLVRRAFRED